MVGLPSQSSTCGSYLPGSCKIFYDSLIATCTVLWCLLDSYFVGDWLIIPALNEFHRNCQPVTCANITTVCCLALNKKGKENDTPL